jgi:hypothetical protein
MACAITRYDCAHDVRTIDELANAANAQQAKNEGFNHRVQPWKARCNSADWHYVAKNPAGLICGWLRATLYREKGQTYIYLAEISTRRIKDEFFGGVGRRLHDALISDATGVGADFIYLYPLNDKVASIYETWGYVRPRAEIVQQFLILRAPPSWRILDSLMPENVRRHLIAAHEIASQKPEDKGLLQLISQTRRRLLANPEGMLELIHALEEIVGVEALEEADDIPEEERTMTLKAKRDMLRTVFGSVRGGKRLGKTRRRRRL